MDSFLAHTKDRESPTSFWRWSAYTAIAAVMRDNCYRRFGDSRVYPNIYTLILADSAIQRKGDPVKLCERMVKVVNNTKLISGRSSIQGILDELSRTETDKKTGTPKTGGSAIFVATELSAGIVGDPEAIKILTDIYDYKDEYTSRLRGMGTFSIKHICFSMLAASNEELLRDVYDVKALFGGLLGRTFLIRPSEFRPGNSLFDMENTDEPLKDLAGKLLDIANLHGEFVIDNAARTEYDTWYLPFRKSYQNKPDKSGVIGRIHVGVIKLAMILCVDQTNALVVRKEHIVEAISHCMALLPNYSSFIMVSGKSTVSEVAAQLIEDIWNGKGRTISKSDFLARHFYQFDLEIVDKCVITLEQAGLLKTTMAGGTELGYQVTEKCKDVFKLKEEK